MSQPDSIDTRAGALSQPTSASGAPRIALIAIGVVALAVGLLAPPLLLSDFALKLANEGLILGIVALSVAFLMDQAGLVSLGAASVYGGVGYLFALLLGELDFTPLAAALAALAIVIVYSAILGALIVRTNAIAFMMLTLAAGEMISHSVMLEALRDLTSGADGLVVKFRGQFLGMTSADLQAPAKFWPIAWVAAWAVGILLYLVRTSRLGSILRAIRENEERMRFSGFNTYLPRLIGFVLVNIVAAVGGLLHVLNSGFISPESLGIGVSTNALVSALIGGIAGSIGPIAGGFLFTIAQDEFGARGFTQLLTGVAIVVFIVFFPRGVSGSLFAFLSKIFGASGSRRGEA